MAHSIGFTALSASMAHTWSVRPKQRKANKFASQVADECTAFAQFLIPLPESSLPDAPGVCLVNCCIFCSVCKSSEPV
eukprot:1158867-Pelagomonas_calceolata.AAC.18